MDNENRIYQTCGCGGEMTIHTHTLIYKRKVKITKVPVFMCQSCFQYEPHPAVKRDLSRLIQELGDNPTRSRISFAERNEWAFVLNETLNAYKGTEAGLEQEVQRAMAARIDLLLDLLRIASNAADPKWMEEIEGRLMKLVPHSASRLL